MKEIFCVEPVSVLDPSAGSGVFGQAFRVAWPRARTTAIEVKRIESWFLRENYDNHAIGTFEDVYGSDEDSLPSPNFDLVMSNPPFHSWREFVELGLTLVKPGGYVVYLGLTSWNGRSQAGYDLFDTIPPVTEMKIPGAVGFRIRGNDVRDYCFWVFRRSAGERPLPCWVTFNLPRLPGAYRRWTRGVKPGRCSYGQELQKSGSQHILSSLRQRCLPRGVFVPKGSDCRQEEGVAG